MSTGIIQYSICHTIFNHQSIHLKHFQHAISSICIYKMPLSKESCVQTAITAWEDEKVQLKLRVAQILDVPEFSLASGLMESNHVQKRAQMVIN